MASGSQNNTTYQAQKWTNLRAFTIGNTAKNVDGTAAVSWSKDEILGASTDAYFLRGDKTWSNSLSANFSAGTYILAGTYLQAKNHIYMDAGHFYMKYNNTWYDVLHNHNNGNISVNAAGTGLYMAYQNTTFVNWMDGRMELRDGCLSLFPNNSSYREGLRIHATGSWSDITLCGNDNTGNSGTSANSWFIGNNNGNFYIARNGSPGSTAYIGCVSNVWKFVTNTDIPEGAANLSAAATAHTLSIYRNGITIPYQMDNTNDGGMLRVRGSSESNTILELGTWDDSGSGETIQFNYYPTNSQVTPTYSVKVPKRTGSIFLAQPWWTSGNGNNVNDLHSGSTFAYTNHNAPTNGMIVAFDCDGSESYTLQLQGNYSGEALYYRNRNGDKGTWNAWRQLVHNAGTWGISITGSSASCTGNALTCSYPYGFSSKTDNATWGNTTGTSIVSWNDSTGGSIAFRRDNPSAGKMSVKVDGRFYGNEGTYPAMLMRYENSYWGLCDPDAANNVWIRTTTAGIIPYQSGGASAGHCGLGTSSWYFASAYIQNIYGYLHGNISGSSASCTGNAATATTAAACSGNAATATNVAWTGITSNPGLYANDVTSYGNIKATTAKGGYYGITFGTSQNCMTAMSSGQHNGLYVQAHRWVLYYDSTNDRMALGSSSTHSSWFLQVNGDTYCTGAIYSGDNRGGTLRMISDWLGFYQNVNAGGKRYGYIECNADRMYFRKENSSTQDHYFDFGSAMYVNGAIGCTGSITTNAALQTGSGITIRRDPSSGNCKIWFATNAAVNKWRIGVDGNDRFAISAYADGEGNYDFWVYNNGACYYKTSIGASSRYIKHNINLLTMDTGNIIDRMEPVSFVFNNDPRETTNLGFIYEDLVKILPEVCFHGEGEDNNLGINYTGIIPVLVKELQSLRKRLAAVETELNSYRSKT